jgi:hypothetical protein
MPNPSRKSPVALEQLLSERVEAVVAKHTGGPFSRPRVTLALREVLEAGQLSRTEEQRLAASRFQGIEGGDLLELSIAARIERALTAGLEAAVGSADEESLADLPRLVVLRDRIGRSGLDLLASDAPTGAKPTLVLTDAQSFEALRSSSAAGQAAIEVVEVTGDLQALADRLGAQLSGGQTAPLTAFETAPEAPETPESIGGTLAAREQPPTVEHPSFTNRVLAGAAVVWLLIGIAWVLHLALRPAPESQAQEQEPMPRLEVESLDPDGLALPPAGVLTFVADRDGPAAAPGPVRLALKALPGEPSRVELVRRADAGDVAVGGLIPEWSADHVDVRIAAPGGLQRWDSVCLKLTVQGQALYSEAMSFAHVGRDAWRFGSLAVPIPGAEDVLLGSDGDVVLDPRGLRLLIALEWTADGGAEEIETLVAEPRVRANGSEWVNTRFHEPRPGGAWYAIDLDELALARPTGAAGATSTRIEVEAGDVSGNVNHTAFGLLPVTTPLELTGFEVLDLDRNEPPRNERLDLVVSSRAPKVRIHGAFNRAVTGSVAVRNERSEFTRSAPLSGRELASTLDLSAGEDYSGSIRITARDLVPHGDLQRGAHQVEVESAFEYTSKEATFAAALEVSGRAVELAPGGASLTSAEESLLTVRSRNGISLLVRVSVSGAGASITPDSAAIDASSEARFVLRMASDGQATVRIQSFRHDHGGPEMDQSYTVLRDSRAPVLAFDADEIVVREDGEVESNPRLWVDRHDEERIGTQVELHDWKLRRRGGSADLPLAEFLPVSAQPCTPVPVPLPRVVEDGTYELSVRARDAAGNETEAPAVLNMSVGREGPVVRFEYPQGLEWRPREGRYPVVVRIEDPNGIRAAARCRVRAIGGSLPDKAMLLTEGPGTQWQAECQFTHEWSGQAVELSIEVEDTHGNPGAAAPRRHQLPIIALEYPAAVALNGPNSAVITRMRIVETAGNGAYEFKGRQDDVENALFESAELPPYAGRGERRSWRILYAEGEIPPFYMDEYEVTNAQYSAFMRATGAGGPPYLKDASLTPEQAARPVVGVTWDEADAYARWVGKRLPSYVEWEYALRGGPKYRPYSSWVQGCGAPSSDEINVLGPAAFEASSLPWPAGRGHDVTPEGIWNLSGNVSEWTSTPFYFDESVRSQPSNLKQHAARNRHRYLRPDSDSAPEFWIAGGCYELRGCHFARNDQRRRDVRLDTVGFRCASDADVIMMGLQGSSPRFVGIPTEEER